jgi:alpha-mannosidase
VPHYTGFIGRWKAWRRWPLGGRWGRPGSGFLVRQPIAWLATHRHDRRGRDEPYVFCYLFAFVLELPPGAGTIRLPDDPAVRLFAATLSDEPFSATEPATTLYD